MLLSRGKRTLPDLTREREGVKIDKAYRELSKQAFLIWIRIAVIPESDLVGMGVAGMARELGYSKKAMWTIVQELRNKGYISYVASSVGRHKVEISLVKRPLIVGHTAFIVV